MMSISHALTCLWISTSSALGFFTHEKNTVPVYSENKTAIVLESSQPRFTIQLKSNPTTGYSWSLTEYNAEFIELVEHHFVAPAKSSPMMTGVPGYETWTFRAKCAVFLAPQQTVLRFVYRRSWENVAPAKQIIFYLDTRPKQPELLQS